MTPIRAAQHAASSLFDVSHAELIGRDRSHPVVLYRQACMAACVDMGERTSIVARSFGGRDHTTVLHAVARVHDDERLRLYADHIRKYAEHVLSRAPRWISAVPFKSSRSA